MHNTVRSNISKKYQGFDIYFLFCKICILQTGCTRALVLAFPFFEDVSLLISHFRQNIKITVLFLYLFIAK